LKNSNYSHILIYIDPHSQRVHSLYTNSATYESLWPALTAHCSVLKK